MSDTEAPQEDKISEPQRRRLRWCWWLTGIVLVMAIGLTAAAFALKGRQFTAPDWLRDEITSQINARLNGSQMVFDDVVVTMQSNWIPHVELRNLAVNNDAGVPLVRLANVSSTFALRPLLSREVKPGTVHISGVSLRLRRAEDGTLGVAVGDMPRSTGEAPSFRALVGQIDGVFKAPELSALKRVEVDNITLRYEDARSRQAWTVDGGRAQLAREGDELTVRSDFALLGNRGYATTLEMNYATQIGDPEADFGMSFEDMPARDIARQSPALAVLDTLDAPISGSIRASVDGDGALGPLSATLQIGAGVLQPTDATRPIPFEAARTYFTYDPATQSMRFDELFLDSKWVTARAEGKAFLVAMEQGLPTEIWTQFQISEVSTNPDGLYPEPVLLEAITSDARITLDPFGIDLGEMSLSDQGSSMVLDGRLEAAPEGWVLGLDARMDALTPERLIALWPESFKTGTRNWIRDNVTKAQLSNLQFSIRMRPEEKPDLFLGFDFTDLTSTFLKTLPSLEQASGHASLFDLRFAIEAREGYVTAPQGGRINAAGSSFVIPFTGQPNPPAEVNLTLDSTITATLSLLDQPPWKFLTKAGQPVTLADGRLRSRGQLKFPLKAKIAPNELSFDFKGTAREVRSEKLVQGRVLAAPRLDVIARNGLLEIKGDGRIGRVPASATWRAGLGPKADGTSRVTGTVELSERFTDEFNIALPPRSISGAGRGQITLDFAKGRAARYSLTSNLAGLGLRLDPVGWSLSRSGKGKLAVSGNLGSPPTIDALTLSGGGLSADGSVSLRSNGGLERARFKRVRIGDWIDAPVDIVGQGANQPPAVQVRGGRIDLRKTTVGGGSSGSGGSSGKSGPVSLTLDRLQITDSIALTGFKTNLDMTKGPRGRFSGKVNGQAAVTGQIAPQGGRSAFRIESDNAGGVLKAAGLLQNARNGRMDLILRPGQLAGSYNGRLLVNRIRLKEAPALAALLNALSVVGILEQLAGDGIHFNEVEARFQLTPERVTLVEGSAVGASMGISMEGYYFFDRQEMDMQGVFSPIYLVNAVGRIFSRKGEGLIGFNYRLNGPPDNPRVRVNPLSALTPGMFREIFRKPPPEIQR